MRRKIIQHFADVFCQRFIQVPNGYDLATFVHLGSGLYTLDILIGDCTRNSIVISKLNTCSEHKKWLIAQLNKHKILLSDIEKAELWISVVVSEIKVETSFGNVFASANFTFDCRSEIKTDEKSYKSALQNEKAWGFDLYYEKLYGSPLGLLQHP